jgi:hypothetical protein
VPFCAVLCRSVPAPTFCHTPKPQILTTKFVLASPSASIFSSRVTSLKEGANLLLQASTMYGDLIDVDDGTITSLSLCAEKKRHARAKAKLLKMKDDISELQTAVDDNENMVPVITSIGKVLKQMRGLKSKAARLKKRAYKSATEKQLDAYKVDSKSVINYLKHQDKQASLQIKRDQALGDLGEDIDFEAQMVAFRQFEASLDQQQVCLCCYLSSCSSLSSNVPFPTLFSIPKCALSNALLYPQMCPFPTLFSSHTYPFFISFL